jgi:hypothetical protein
MEKQLVLFSLVTRSKSLTHNALTESLESDCENLQEFSKSEELISSHSILDWSIE